MPTARMKAPADTPFRRAGRKIRCPKCGAGVDEKCIYNGRRRVVNHQARLDAQGIQASFRNRRKPVELKPGMAEKYRAIQAAFECPQCGAGLEQPCLGVEGTPIRSCHTPRYVMWRETQQPDD